MRQLAGLFVVAGALLWSVGAGATADGPPSWAFAANPPATQPAAPAPDDGQPRHVPGSNVALTLAQTKNPYDIPDWHPDDHPPAPDIVTHGRKSGGVLACGLLPSAQWAGPAGERRAGGFASRLYRAADRRFPRRRAPKLGPDPDAAIPDGRNRRSGDRRRGAAGGRLFLRAQAREMDPCGRKPRPCPGPASPAICSCPMRKAGPSRSAIASSRRRRIWRGPSCAIPAPASSPTRRPAASAG